MLTSGEQVHRKELTQSPPQLIDSTQEALSVTEVETISTARGCGKNGTFSSIHTTVS